MASVINEDFELLSVADLQGQGSWTGPASKFDVQSSVTQAGSRAVKGTAPGGVNGAFRVFGAYVTAGEQTIYINHNADRVGVDAKMVILNTTSPTTTDYTANGSGCIGLFREAGPDLRASVMTGDNNETGRMKQYLMFTDDRGINQLRSIFNKDAVQFLEVQGMPMADGVQYSILVTPVIPVVNQATPEIEPKTEASTNPEGQR